jgi:hypothetical protein
MLTMPADVVDIQRRDHTLIGLCEARAPEGGAWHQMFVQSGTVTLSELGSLPCRTCQVTVLGWTQTETDVMDFLDVLGGWIRLTHKVVRANGSYALIPLGYFRVSRLELHPLDGTITISGEDSGALVRDYNLTTLKQGEVAASSTFVYAADIMLAAAMDGIPAWWSGSTVDRTDAPSTSPGARMQLEGSRVDAVTKLIDNLKYKIRVPIDGSSAFRFVKPNTPSNTAVITVRGGQLGNLADTSTVQDRQGIANVALTKYTTQQFALGARLVTKQRRLVEEYSASDADVRAGGPFGRVTMDVDSTSVTTDSGAIAAADLALKKSLTQSRDFTVVTSPIYGLEEGDVIRLEQREGTGMRGVLVGGSIGLTASDSWTLTLRAFAPVGRWGGGVRRSFITDASDIRDEADWIDTNNSTVDTTGNTLTGWTIVNGQLGDGGSTIMGLGDGGNVMTLESLAAWAWPSTERARVRFTMGSVGPTPTFDMWMRAYIRLNGVKHYQHGWAIVLGDKTAMFEADITVVGSGNFSVGIDMAGDSHGGPLPDWRRFRCSEADVTVAALPKVGP